MSAIKAGADLRAARDGGNQTRSGRTARRDVGPYLLLIVAALLAWPSVLAAATDTLAARVIVLANASQPESIQLARYYAMRRGIPEGNIVALAMPTDETITWSVFIETIWQPLQDELIRRGWIDALSSSRRDAAGRKRIVAHGHRISYLVACRGVPLRIANDPERLQATVFPANSSQLRTNEAAVDSELALLARDDPAINSYLPNPLYLKQVPTSLELAQVIKVCRLDGPDDAAARALVDHAIEGERTGLLGRAYLDLGGPHPQGEQWLGEVGKLLAGMGYDTQVDREPTTLGPAERFDAPVLYFGWYAGSLNGPMALEGFRFPAGAVAVHIHSFSATTLRSTTDGWVGPLVERGVTATVGNVFEPYLQLTHNPALLLAALENGLPFGDAVAFAMPALSWQPIAVGDPLYRPFAVSLEAQLAGGTQLPADRVGYAVIRLSHLLEAAGEQTEALALLRREFAARPSAPLALALAERLDGAGDRTGAVAALAGLGSGPEPTPGEWGMVRAAAQKLAALAAPEAAQALYRRLLGSTGLPEDLRVLFEQERSGLRSGPARK